MDEKNCFNSTFQIKNLTIINEKYFVYQDKEYLMNFDLLKANCYYFYQNQNKYEQTKHINLNNVISDQILLNDESIRTFISSFQNEPFTISEKSIIPLQYLAHIFNFPELIKITDNFIEEHWSELIFQILLFKISNKANNQSTFFDTTKEERFISSHLKECIKNKGMVLLPVPLIHRIILSNTSNGQFEGEFLRELIEFLFKCLDKHGREASVLFNVVDFGEVNVEVVDHLLQNYSEIFDFSLINLTLLKTTKELCSDLARQKEEYSRMFAEMKEAFEEHKANEKKIVDLENKFIQNEKLHQTEKVDLENKFTNFEEKLSQMNDKLIEQEEIIANYQNINQQNEQIIKSQESKINELEEKHQKEKDQFESKFKIIDEKLTQQNELINNYQIQNKQLEQLIKSQEEKLDKQEEFIQIIKNHFIDIKATISATVQPDQIIKGEINITDNLQMLDKTRSRYVLNTNSSPILGEESYSDGNLIQNLSESFSFYKPSGTYYLHLLTVDKKGHKNEIISQPLTTQGKPLTFEYTGKIQSAALEAGKYKLEVWGSEGGKNGSYNGSSGKGGYSVGTINLKEKTTLYVYVGESPKSVNGGWNGGGSGADQAAGGGGSTDISLFGEEGSADWNNSRHLYSRIIVAGAGGGSGSTSQYYGGYGGGEEGQSSGYGPAENGGTQTRAGTNNDYSTCQGFGIGGTHTGKSSGGGSGWYGGGASKNSGGNTGGSGGSGYVFNSSTANNYPGGCLLNEKFYLIESSTHAGNSAFPNSLGTSNETGHTGNGYAKITPL